MRSAYLLPFAEPSRAGLRRRATSIALTVAAHLVLLWLLFRLAPNLTEPPQATRQTTFELLPDASERPQATKQPVKKAAQKAARAAPASREAPPALPPTPLPAPTPAPTGQPWNIMREDFDLAKVPKRGREDDAAGTEVAGADAGADSAQVAGPGEGPGGQRLYNADWYREPTDAELGFYLKRGAPAGAWAMIACRTVEKYHVEDCRSLGESPVGSGLANAIRQAAWQFLVIPPRIGGRAMIGTWVRIRIDFTERGAAVR